MGTMYTSGGIPAGIGTGIPHQFKAACSQGTPHPTPPPCTPTRNPHPMHSSLLGQFLLNRRQQNPNQAIFCKIQPIYSSLLAHITRLAAA